MNTPNNKRRKQSRAKIESMFVELLQTRELNQISVSDICKGAGVNRSTFYSNYEDIYALADVVRLNLEQNIAVLYRDEIRDHISSSDFSKLLCHIAENQLFYKTYFKLGYDNTIKTFFYDHNLAEKHFNNQMIPYHIAFFKAGFTAILKMWLAGGCKEPPEEINEIVKSEYRGRSEFFAK